MKALEALHKLVRKELNGGIEFAAYGKKFNVTNALECLDVVEQSLTERETMKAKVKRYISMTHIFQMSNDDEKKFVKLENKLKEWSERE